MAEINHQFTAGRMNKDLDERLVPNGEYRDALNVEVSTSEGSAVGTVQSLWGNKIVGSAGVSDSMFCVGSITWPKENKVIWLATTENKEEPIDSYDYIYEYDIDLDTVSTVFKEQWKAVTTSTTAISNSVFLTVADGTAITDSMTAAVYNSSGQITHNNLNIQGVGYANVSGWLVQLAMPQTIPNGATIVFEDKNRVLGFDANYLVTGINILDDILFWTDNNTEPKKINITRCKYGTLPANLTNNSTSLFVMGANKGKMKYDNVTMIKKSPISPPVITMHRNDRSIQTVGGAITTATFSHSFQYTGGDDEGNQLQVGANSNVDPHVSNIVIPAGTTMPAWQSGDVINLNYHEHISDFSERMVVRISIISIFLNSSTGLYEIEFEILSITENLDITIINPTTELPEPVKFEFQLEEKNPLFEFKFPRFAYRWKYEDGEYSAFSPFSEVAFLPEEFDYVPKKGYNLGMTNSVRFLVISQFLPQNDKHQTPLDVVEVDIVYKESNSTNTYTVETIKGPSTANQILQTDYMPADLAWQGLIKHNAGNGVIDVAYPAGVTGSTSYNATYSLWNKAPEGSFRITTDLIHAAIPSNQMLRPWDNVPRKALAQELTGNRVVYGNYLQQYNMLSYGGIVVAPKFQVRLSSRKHTYGEFGGMTPVQYDPGSDGWSQYGVMSNGASQSNWVNVSKTARLPEKSIKSIRNYQMGVVYMDEYGRQTPVLTDESGTIRVEKTNADSYNHLNVRLDDGTAVSPNYPLRPHWATHYKYFVKETSNEYYNLAMDRFYPAEDGNVWLSFPSSERNKVDEETYLILKKQHDNDVFVKETARYKILAINNEAPVFIKTQQRSMGSTTVNFGSAGEPQPGYVHLDIPKSVWEDNWGLNYGQGDDPDVTVFRVKKDTTFSKWYTMTSKTLINNHMRIKSTRSFKDDMASFIADDTTVPVTMDTGLQLELASQVVTQLPEFEGRFFVKVYNDIVLEKNLPRKDLVASMTPSIVKGINWWSVRENSESGHKYWFKEGPDGHSPLLEWFLDECSGMGWNSKGARTIGGSGCTSNDACGGHIPNPGGSFNLNRSPGHNTVFNNSPGQPQFGNQISNTVGVSANWTYAYDLSNINGPKGLCGMHPTGSGLFNSGHHGRPNSQVVADSMHLSYTGIGPGAYEHVWDPMNPDADAYNAEHEFADAMSRSGTRFRWRGDTVIYEIVGSPAGHTEPKCVNIENYDNEDKWGDGGDYKEAHNKRWRIALRFEPPMPTVPGGVEDAPGGGTQIMTGYDPRTHISKDTLQNWNIQPPNNYSDHRFIEILSVDYDEEGDFTSDNPAIWETEPKEDVGLDLYYEASPAYPIGEGHYYHGSWQPLNWFNCYSFGNGVESNRIRDDYNAVQIDKNPKVSMPLAEQYMEERKWSGLIFSGIYNSTSGINRLNQFIQAEAITKDLQPAYGSIQKLHSKSTADGDLIALCEDRVIKILANKDALYNADGSANVTANKNVLGQAIPYTGDHGISRNPESFATDSYRSYFTDKDRGAVMRLSQNGLTAISDQGMRDWFHDKLKEKTKRIVGSYDDRKDLYHVSFEKADDDGTIFSPPTTVNTFLMGVPGNAGRGVGVNAFDATGTGQCAGCSASGTTDSYFDSQKALDPGDIGFYASNGDSTFIKQNVTDIVITAVDANGVASLTLQAPWSQSMEDIGGDQFKLGYSNDVNIGPLNTAGVTRTFIAIYNQPPNTITPEELLGGKGVAVFEAQPGILDGSSNDVKFKLIESGINNQWSSINSSKLKGAHFKVEHVYGSAEIWSHEYWIKIWDIGAKTSLYWNKTVSYSEKTGGWVSFKSWIQESGLSINNKFYTFNRGSMWRHYAEDGVIATYYPNSVNEIYEEPYVDVLLNDMPASVKTYSALNYEGSEQRITKNLNDGEYYNLSAQSGWYNDSLITNLETGFLNDFIEKEGKYFNYVKDDKENTLANLDVESFNTQGIGRASGATFPPTPVWTNISVTDLGDQD